MVIAWVLIAIAAYVAAFNLALQKKDYAFYFATDSFPRECSGKVSLPELSSELRSGSPVPADWEQNDRLDHLIASLQKPVGGAYPGMVSACTSNKRMLTHLALATAFLVLLAGPLFVGRSLRSRRSVA